MTRPFPFVFLFLPACLGFESLKDSTDSYEADADADTDADTDTDVPPVSHVVSALSITPLEDSLDLDSDGEADNAAAAFASELDPVFSEGLVEATNVLVFQMCGVDSWSMDRSVNFSVFSAVDTDGDLMDNYTGGETFAAGASLDDSGCATSFSTSGLSSGQYDVVLDAQDIVVGTDSFRTATGIFLNGSADDTLNSGVLATAFSVESIAVVAKAEGLDDYITLLEAVADIDTNADGTGDAISFNFSFDAVACGVE